MSVGRRTAALTVAACALVSAYTTHVNDGEGPQDRLLYDLAVWVRGQLLSSPQSEPVAVIAVDERSLATGDLVRYPRAFFSPFWARTVEALDQAGARAVGFDFIFAYSANVFDRDFDRDFARVLFQHADKVVLGRSAATLPVDTFARPLTARGGESLGLLEIEPDVDGIYRTVSRGYESVSGNVVPGLVAVTLAKAGVEMPQTVRLAPRRNPERIPTYALIDVLDCAESDPEALRRVFEDRVVFVGTALPDEDRKVSSGRFLPPPPFLGRESAMASEACSLEHPGASAMRTFSTPGVYLHAEAASAVLRDDLVSPLPLPLRTAAATASGALGAMIGLTVMPWIASLLVVSLALLLWGVEVAALAGNVWYPAGPSMFGVLACMVIAYLVRYLVEDRRRRRIQKAFGRYLAPSLVESLTEGNEDPKLGGVERPVSVMFADLSGFTKLSTTVTPEQLVAITNEYLALVADIIDSTQGYVDKYIGDAVMAIWGAPVPDPDHALKAVRAALRIEQAVRERREAAEAEGRHGFGIKVGIYSGLAVVGNVGSERRFNYTAVGETVNIASRLESLPGVFGCAIVIGESTAELVRGQIELRELDRVSVKGREAPVTLYEPLGERGDGALPEHVAPYQQALSLYRHRQFPQAAEIWRRLAAADGPSAVMCETAEEYALRPPPADWTAVRVLTTK